MKRMLITLITLSALSADAALAIDLNAFTIDGGGGTSSANGFVLTATNGQPDAGFMSGDDFELQGGFWTSLAPAVACQGDADGDNDIDITDLGIVLSQFGMVGPGLAGDVDGDNDVDITDLGLVLANFGTSC
jgi:hypothetical protein